MRQGLLGIEPDGKGDAGDPKSGLSVRRDLLSSVAGEIDMMTGGRRLDGVAAKVGDALGRLATATGKAKAGGEWARAEAEADALLVRPPGDPAREIGAQVCYIPLSR